MNDSIKILVVGDIVGTPGRRVCSELIPKLRDEKSIDFVIANGENVAGGSGINPKTIDELFRSGIDVITTGDHAFRRKEALPIFQENSNVLRPANYPSGAPGKGYSIYRLKSGIKVGVINLLGRVFLNPIECPFAYAKEIVNEIQEQTKIILVDFHAEATSEKIGMGWFLDGKVSAVCGTHTHVQTADESILPNGTAYITDLGMVGPFKSVLGREVKPVLHRFLTQLPSHFQVASEDLRLNGVIISIDVITSKAMHIERLQVAL